MAVSPDTIIKLLKVPIEIDNFNQLTFANATDQYNYFNSLPKLTEEELYYQRKDNYISWPAHIDSIIEYNYVMYQNSNYSNKWFYAFITNMEYENDGTTRIYIETDVFQTWQFQIQYKYTFIDREHTLDDTIGNNLIPENLQLGEYVINKFTKYPTSIGTNPDLYYVIGVTETYDSTTNTWTKVDGDQYNGTYCAYKYIAIPTNTGLSSLQLVINTYNQAAKESAIVCIFLMPYAFITENGNLDPLKRFVTSSTTPFVYIINENNSSADLTNTTLDSYTPINNKLKTFPFSFINISNNAGSNVIYRYEDFYTFNNNTKTLISSPSFKVKSTLTPSGSARLIPLNYKGEAENELEGINMGKYPICCWMNDIYINWLTQNGVNIGLSVAGSVLSAGTGFLTGNAIGVATGILGIANTLGEIYKESLTPPQIEGNINNGDIITIDNKNVFHIEVKSIKKEMAKIIDDYFSMYGYKTNKVKLPNITGRRNWNYVKTINCNLEGNIPQMDLQKIKEIFNQGVTLWHNTNTFLDYTQNNDIL